MKEEWKDIEEWEGLYVVSNFGRVYSIRKNIFMKKQINTHGYQIVDLRINGKRSHKSVHRLMACAFIENPKNKSDVNHKDGVKANNDLQNLEWATRSENLQHSYDNGLSHAYDRRGENNPKCKINKRKAVEIVSMLNNGISASSIADEFGISRSHVHRVEKHWLKPA